MTAPSSPVPGEYYGEMCARCGSTADSQDCGQCGRTGYDGHDCGEDCCGCLHPEDNVRCDVCDGRGHFDACMSTSEWCMANPLPGRETVARGAVESVYVADAPR